jgi:hypothetical protein
VYSTSEYNTSEYEYSLSEYEYSLSEYEHEYSSIVSVCILPVNMAPVIIVPMGIISVYMSIVLVRTTRTSV